MIDVNGGQVSNGTNIQIYDQNDTDSQKWKIIITSGGFVSFQSKLNSNFCLDVEEYCTSNGKNVQLYEKMKLMLRNLGRFLKNCINIELELDYYVEITQF